MSKTTIALIAAIPEEINPFLHRAGTTSRENLAGFPCYRFTLNGQNCCLIESGMGAKRATAATKALISASNPRVVISFGFAGAVVPGPSIGDIVVAERLLCHHNRFFTEEPGLSAPLTDTILSVLADHAEVETFAVFRGTFITTAEIASKRELSQLLPAGSSNPVLEMETAAVSRVTAQAGIPFAAVRAISDAAREELGFTMAELVDQNMDIRIGKVLLTIARKPRIIPQLFRLARNVKIAGNNLATALALVTKHL